MNKRFIVAVRQNNSAFEQKISAIVKIDRVLPYAYEIQGDHDTVRKLFGLDNRKEILRIVPI